MFLGTYAADLDRENRLRAPAAFHLGASTQLFVMKGFERNLMVLTAGSFEALSECLSSLNIADPAARLLLRLSLGTAQPVRIDAEGALPLPDGLKAFAGLKADLRIVGVGDYFEVWSGEKWSQQEMQIQDSEANSDRFAKLTLTTR